MIAINATTITRSLFLLAFCSLIGLLLWERAERPLHSKQAPKPIFVGEDDYHPLMIHVPRGRFVIGSIAALKSERLASLDHRPQKVQIPYDFLMMSTELNGRIAHQLNPGSNYSSVKCIGDCPAINISWFDAIELANKLSKKTGLESCYVMKSKRILWPKGVRCLGYRLPLEEEWEYAAKAGIKSKPKTDRETIFGHAWFEENSDKKPRPIALKEPNALGLYDMQGNVREWCWDDWEKQESIKGFKKVLRGGAWNSQANQLHLEYRSSAPSTWRRTSIGVRFVRTVSLADQ